MARWRQQGKEPVSIVIWHRLQKLRFLQLLLYILVFTLIMPFFQFDWVLQLVSDIFLLNALLVSLSTGPQSRRWQAFLWILFGSSLLLTVFSIFATSPDAKWWFLSLGLKIDVIFLSLCLVAILQYVFAGSRINIDKIFAVIVAYLILSLIFAQIYSLIFMYQPHSFNLSWPTNLISLQLLHSSFIYYSIIVITTVGIGDIMPLTPIARTFTMIEAVTGQFFVAVLVAWLVGRFLYYESTPAPPPDRPPDL
jgi:voltage-gated potassium channel